MANTPSPSPAIFDASALPQTGLVRREVVREMLSINLRTEQRLKREGRLPKDRIAGWYSAEDLRRVLCAPSEVA